MTLPLFLADPDRPEALDEAGDAYFQHCLDQRLLELSEKLKSKKPLTVADLGKMDKEVRLTILAQATHEAMRLQGYGTELLERVTAKTALKILREKSQRLDRDPNDKTQLEDDNFLNFLDRKLALVKSSGQRADLNYLITMMVQFYESGEGKMIEDLFRDRRGYSTLLRATAFVRQKQNAVVASDKRFDAQLEAKHQLSLMLLGEANIEQDPKKKKQILAKREKVKAELADIRERKKEVTGELQEEANEALLHAVIMSRMEEVAAHPSKDRKGIMELLYGGVKPVLARDEKGKEIPNTYVLQYPKTKQVNGDQLVGKIVAKMMYVDGHVAFVLHSPMEAEAMVKRVLEQVAEIELRDALPEILDLIHQSDMDHIVWKKLAEMLEKKLNLHKSANPQ